MADKTSRPCSSVPSRYGVRPLSSQSGGTRLFDKSSAAGLKGFCGAMSGAAIAAKAKPSVSKAANIVVFEFRNAIQRSLLRMRPRGEEGAAAFAITSSSAGAGGDRRRHKEHRRQG